MNDLVASVRRQLDQRCIDGGQTLRTPRCEVSLAQMPRTRVVADLDRPGSPLDQHATRCDFLIFAEEGVGKSWKAWIVPLELKARLEIRKVTAQLQAGADVASRLVADAAGIAFVPIVACRLKKGQRKYLKDSLMRVRFKNRKPEPYRLMKCGGKLSDQIR